MFTVNNLESRKKHTGKKCKLSIILLSFFFFLQHHVTYGISVPRPSIKLRPPAVKMRRPNNTGPQGDSL